MICSVLENIFYIFKNQENKKDALLEYKNNSVLIGKKIKVYPVIDQIDNYYFCTVEDISDDAKLVVRTEDNNHSDGFGLQQTIRQLTPKEVFLVHGDPVKMQKSQSFL